MPKLYLLDAHALCYRAFYAVKGLVNSHGQPTNAVFGFTNTLKKILKDFQPEHFAVCFDRAGKTFRQEKYAAYKIQRPAMPDDLRSQMELIKQVVRGYQLPIMEVEGYEADDLMATAVDKFAAKGVEVVIITDDKDLFQLIGDRVKVYSPRREKMLERDDVVEILGVEPDQVADFLGLAGDSSDNIPGVLGIGKVSAQKLIAQFGSLENIYASLDKITSKSLRQKLEAQRQEAFLSRDLAKLRTDADVAGRLDDLKVRQPDAEALYALFSQLEFHRFAAEMQVEPKSDSGVQVKETPLSQDVDLVVAQAKKEKRICFSFDAEGAVLYLSAGKEMIALKEKEIGKTRAIFEDEEILKVTYDLKAQYKILCRQALTLKGKIFDVMLAGYLTNATRTSHELSALSWQYLKTMLPETVSPRALVEVAVQLYQPLLDDLKRSASLPLFETIEIPLALVLARMEETGVRIDLKVLRDLSDDCAKRIGDLEKEIYAIAGEPFNINSPKQLSHILFEKLKLPVVKKIKTGFSTNEEVLNKLASKHALPATILEYRQLVKLKSTYIDALPELAVASDEGEKRDIIHASFNQTVAETGRLSSSNPNLQNIPIRTEMGRQIRRAFIPLAKGHVLVSADYSQIELRILAHLSQDENLMRAFEADEDIHAFTAGLMFDCPVEKVTPEMRNSAKRVNFGIVYGMSAFGLAKDLGISNPQAQDFIDRYFLRYPKVKIFMEQAIAQCREKGYAVTLMNRRRDIPEIVSPNAGIRQFAERQAINTPLQGSAADLMKLAMVNVQQRLDEAQLKSRMIITVHDEIVFDVIPAEEKQVLKLVCREMEQAMTLTVPIRVVAKKGLNWLEMEKVSCM